MKCQSFNGSHFAKECKSDHDMCGTCAGEHQTKHCTASVPEGLRCANCKEAGHAAWDRDCPIFINLCQHFHAHLPDTNYRYYPKGNDPSTWECEPGPDYPQPEPQRLAHRTPQPHPMFAHKDGWKTVERRWNTTSDQCRPTTQPNCLKNSATQNCLPEEWTKRVPQGPAPPCDTPQEPTQSKQDSPPPLSQL